MEEYKRIPKFDHYIVHGMHVPHCHILLLVSSLEDDVGATTGSPRWCVRLMQGIFYPSVKGRDGNNRNAFEPQRLNCEVVERNGRWAFEEFNYCTLFSASLIQPIPIGLIEGFALFTRDWRRMIRCFLKPLLRTHRIPHHFTIDRIKKNWASMLNLEFLSKNSPVSTIIKLTNQPLIGKMIVLFYEKCCTLIASSRAFFKPTL